MNNESKYNPKIHHRKSIRLKGYDYSQAELYFITICLQNRECLFGHIENGEMILNDAGIMIKKWYRELTNKFPDIKCDEMIVMPNHFHCIVENIGAVRADLRVCPDNTGVNPDVRTNDDEQSEPFALGEPLILGEHIGSPLRAVMQWFKTITTNEYIRGVNNLGWAPFNGKLWQRNYYEHIIRNDGSYQRIANYIRNNPSKWNDDKFYQL